MDRPGTHSKQRQPGPASISLCKALTGSDAQIIVTPSGSGRILTASVPLGIAIEGIPKGFNKHLVHAVFTTHPGYELYYRNSDFTYLLIQPGRVSWYSYAFDAIAYVKVGERLAARITAGRG